MAWLRIDDRFRTHPKVVRAKLGGWLAFCGISYCREHLTDGVIPREAVATLAAGLPNPYKHAARLVEVGLWYEHPDGYRVHDFLDWNPSKEDVKSLRDKERDKKRTQRGHTGDSHAGARTGAGDAGLGSDSQDRDLGSQPSEESARETANIGGKWTPQNPHDPPKWGNRRATGAGSRADTLVQAHPHCVPCAFEACARGVCVPAFLVGQWLAQKGHGPAAEGYVREFVGRVLARFPEGHAFGEEPLKFWRAEWNAEHGSHARQVTPEGRGAQAVGAFGKAFGALESKHENRTPAATESARVVGRGSTSTDR